MAPKKVLFLTVPLKGHVAHTARLSEFLLREPGRYEIHVGCPSEGAAHLPKGVTIHLPIEGEPDPDAESVEEPFLQAADSNNWQDSMAAMMVSADMEYILGLPLFGIRLLGEISPDIVICDHTYQGANYLHTACREVDVPLVVIISMGRPESMNKVSNVLKLLPAILARAGSAFGSVGPLLTAQRKLQQEVGTPISDQPVQITPSSTIFLEEPPPDDLYFTGPFIPMATVPRSFDAALGGHTGLAQWLLTGSAGGSPIIFIALGTLVSPSEELLERIVDALDNEKWRVLWALPASHQSLLPSRSFSSLWRIESFVPQLAVLRSGAISCFVSHCGANSTLESMAHGVPMVCMPFFADQYEWAGAVCDFKKAGVQIDKFTSDDTEIRDAVEEVIQDPQYRQNAQTVAREMREQAEATLAHLGVRADERSGAGLPMAAAVIEAVLRGEDPKSVMPPARKGGPARRRTRTACC